MCAEFPVLAELGSLLSGLWGYTGVYKLTIITDIVLYLFWCKWRHVHGSRTVRVTYWSASLLGFFAEVLIGSSCTCLETDFIVDVGLLFEIPPFLVVPQGLAFNVLYFLIYVSWLAPPPRADWDCWNVFCQKIGFFWIATLRNSTFKMIFAQFLYSYERG